jgi:hypothetical protein
MTDIIKLLEVALRAGLISNNGLICDVVAGPCACGISHQENEAFARMRPKYTQKKTQERLQRERASDNQRIIRMQGLKSLDNKRKIIKD